MVYKIWEKVLNECVGSPEAVLLTEVDASSFKEACDNARLMFPGKNVLRLVDPNGRSVEINVCG